MHWSGTENRSVRFGCIMRIATQYSKIEKLMRKYQETTISQKVSITFVLSSWPRALKGNWVKTKVCEETHVVY